MLAAGGHNLVFIIFYFLFFTFNFFNFFNLFFFVSIGFVYFF